MFYDQIKVEKYTKITPEKVIELRNLTGCGLRDCSNAIFYAILHDSDQLLAVAFLKSKGIAVATPKMTEDERIMSFYRGELEVFNGHYK